MLGRGIGEIHQTSTWNDVFNNLYSILRTSDLVLANLESPFGTKPSSPTNQNAYNLCASPESAQALELAGIDILTLANNHAQDCLEGMSGTQKTLMQYHLATASESISYSITIKNQQIVVIAADDISKPVDMTLITNLISTAKSSGSLVIISIHWGNEYQTGPDQRQQSIAQQLSDAGADIIWGHHPHVLQKTGWIFNKNQDHQTFIAYSLGNALFDQWAYPDANRSAVLTLLISNHHIVNVTALPFKINSRAGITADADPQTVRAVLSRLNIQIPYKKQSDDVK